MYVYVCIHKYTRTYNYICIYAYTCVNMHIYKYIIMYTYIRIVLVATQNCIWVANFAQKILFISLI